jgi:hypothetical protein
MKSSGRFSGSSTSTILRVNLSNSGDHKVQIALTFRCPPDTGQAPGRYNERCREQTTSKAGTAWAPLLMMLKRKVGEGCEVQLTKGYGETIFRCGLGAQFIRNKQGEHVSQTSTSYPCRNQVMQPLL